MSSLTQSGLIEKGDPLELNSVGLFLQCAEDTKNSVLWAEFLRRFSGKIKAFIRGTLRQYLPFFPSASECSPFIDTAHEMDLFQNTVLRLVKNNCAAIRRFSGTTEAELLGYLAIISRSAVRDYLRQRRALKRIPSQILDASQDFEDTLPRDSRNNAPEQAVERGILARELKQLTLNTIKNHPGAYSARDMLIFELYFSHDLSTAQVAKCAGVGLSKTGVEKVLNRLIGQVRSIAAAPLVPVEERG